MRLKQKFENGSQMAKVYWDAEWQEHRVKFFVCGSHNKSADYHCPDLEDAVNTAKYVIGLSRIQFTTSAGRSIMVIVTLY